MSDSVILVHVGLAGIETVPGLTIRFGAISYSDAPMSTFMPCGDVTPKKSRPLIGLMRAPRSIAGEAKRNLKPVMKRPRS